MTFWALFFMVGLHAQVTFENGYFINNQGERINCLIKNKGKTTSPSSFEYKLNENSRIIEGGILNVQEFGIGQNIRFKRKEVLMDKTPILDYNGEPKFENKTLFVKVLVEGKASLFVYTTNSLSRFFFERLDKNIEQLIFKTYYVTHNQIRKNNHFRQQLLTSLKCDALSIPDLKNLEYKEDELISFFEKYNQCAGGITKSYKRKKNKTLFNFKVKSGINFSNFEIDQIMSDRADAKFDLGTTLKIGFEAEMYLNFNKHKWSILFEPTYQKFPDREQIVSGDAVSTDITSFTYSTVNLAFGPRHHIYLNDKNKIFLNVLYNIVISAKSSGVNFNQRTDFVIPNDMRLSVGGGYSFKDKYNIEFRYDFPANPLNNGDVPLWNSTFTNFSIILGYTIFDSKK